MRPTSEVVYLVDDDLRVREALSELLSSQERQHFSLARLRISYVYEVGRARVFGD